MEKRSTRLVFPLVVIIILGGCCFIPKDERPPTLLRTASGIETTEFQLHESILLDAVNLSPRSGYDIQIVRDDGEVINELRLSTDQNGQIPETVIWYDVGALPCPEVAVDTPARAYLSAYEISDFDYAGKSYTIRVRDEEPVREMTFRIAEELIRPVLYAASPRGCHKSGFLIGEEDVWVVGKNLPKGSIIRLWVVSASSEWRDGDELQDKTKRYDDDLPPIFELKGDATSFRRLLWPKGLTSIGSYDIVAEVVTHQFGSYYPSSTAQAQDVVSYLTYSGFVVQRRPGVAEPLEMDIAGVRQSPFTFRNTFLTTEDVYVGVDPCIQPSYVGQTADIYIVSDKADAQWTTDPNLPDPDASGVVETITVGGICGNCWKTLAWASPLTVGDYDVVLDFNQDGVYTPGVDLIDSLDPVGFRVREMRVDSISFNYSGSGAVTIYDNVNGGNISSPEYYSSGHIVKPAAWINGGSYSVQADLKAASTISSAKIWAETGLGGLASASSPVTVTFSGGNGQGTFSVNSIPTVVGKHLFNWDWRYKDVNGAASPISDMEETGEHIVYTLLATPQAPQAIPWQDALDIACGVAMGQTTAANATREIWDDFYNNAGGLYDTISGVPRYASGAGFDLTSWLTNYNSGSIGIVNCYDMGKAVVVFANALGCSAQYTYVGPFGYLNCVKPIGRGWTNNPFYDNPDYDDNPIVGEDTANDWIPNNHAGRSRFGNHGFTRLGGYIYDGSGGQVDVDTNPDAPLHNPYELLDGGNTWTSDYRNKVIDDVPASTPGTPTDYSFTVY